MDGSTGSYQQAQTAPAPPLMDRIANLEKQVAQLHQMLEEALRRLSNLEGAIYGGPRVTDNVMYDGLRDSAKSLR